MRWKECRSGDHGGDENTKVKDDKNIAEEDNCMGWWREQGNSWGRETKDMKKAVNNILINVTVLKSFYQLLQSHKMDGSIDFAKWKKVLPSETLDQNYQVMM